MPKNLTLLDFLDKWPPFLVYALARRSHKSKQPGTSAAIRLDEIVKESGLSRRKVIYLSKKDSWANVTVQTIVDYCRACNFDFFHTANNARFMRHYSGLDSKKFHHLPPAKWRSFVRACERFYQLHEQKSDAS